MGRRQTLHDGSIVAERVALTSPVVVEVHAILCVWTAILMRNLKLQIKEVDWIAVNSKHDVLNIASRRAVVLEANA